MPRQKIGDFFLRRRPRAEDEPGDRVIRDARRSNDRLVSVDRVLPNLLQGTVDFEDGFFQVGADFKLERDRTGRVLTLRRHLDHALDAF